MFDADATARWIFRSLMVLAAALVLTGCPSTGPRTGPPPSVDRAIALSRTGDHAQAGRVYEALAAQNTGTQRNAYLLLAAREFAAARRREEAARVLGMVSAPLTADQTFERQMMEIEVDLLGPQPQQAWQQLVGIPQPTAAPAARRYLELRQRAALEVGRVVDAIRAEMALEPFLTTPEERHQARLELLTGLRAANERGVRVEPRAATDIVIRGWLELSPLSAAMARNPVTATPEVEAWQARYPNHPAREVVRSELLGIRDVIGEQVPHVALLLPLSGRQAAAAATVRDGFMTAYYQAPESERPRLRVYDTSDISAAEAIARASREGAELIVGPLMREEVLGAADLVTERPTILALNFLPSERPAPPGFFQFALSPEDEARIVARRVLADGRRRGVVLVPQGDWGTRVLTAFTQELEAGGGLVLGNAAFDSSQTDYSDAITQVLRLSDSRARHRRLESVLGTKLHFEPRRRGDMEFIFAASQAHTARLLRPQLKFHFAGDIPTYATSEAFEPDPVANEDMEGLIFPDMPWMLGSPLAEGVREAARQAWPSGGPRRNRLFAFGFDAYRLAAALRARAGNPAGLEIDGLTGRLTIDAEQRVRRELWWAEVRNGEARILASAPN